MAGTGQPVQKKLYSSVLEQKLGIISFRIRDAGAKNGCVCVFFGVNQTQRLRKDPGRRLFCVSNRKLPLDLGVAQPASLAPVAARGRGVGMMYGSLVAAVVMMASSVQDMGDLSSRSCRKKRIWAHKTNDRC